MSRVVVVGGGIGGLVAAALLAHAGLEVTVLEAHIYAGGCAGTFYHQGYHFDAGATLAAGFGADGFLSRLGALLGIEWPAEPLAAAMVVHLPSGRAVTRWSDDERWREERRAFFGHEAEGFWNWQEQTANVLWQLAYGGPPWPPQNAADVLALAGLGAGLALAQPLRLPSLLADAVRPVAVHVPDKPVELRRYVDAQLLISAQTTAAHANALYGAAALDMPRRGVAHVRGGMGTVARLLAGAVERFGGKVLYRQRVTRVVMHNGRPLAAETDRGGSYPADAVLFNLPPWDAARLLGEQSPRLHTLRPPEDLWGAFMVYAGIEADALPPGLPLHHQVIAREPLGEGNSVFLSFSPPVGEERGPQGRRTLTASTHTRPQPWRMLYDRDVQAYQERKDEYTERVLATLDIVIPGLRSKVRSVLPATPLAFERFTRRSNGYVGGFPQRTLWRTWGPRLGSRLWLVGDSIFPGQSVLAVALGGQRVAQDVVRTLRTYREYG